MSSVDYYSVLQVAPSADVEVIQAAYRVLARRCHPDLGGSTRQMATLNEAWAVLGDAKARSSYDEERRLSVVVPRYDAYGPRVEQRVASEFDPPPGGPGAPAAPVGSTRLDFSRYSGWMIREVAAHDPDFLEWLARTPLGRRFRDEIAATIEEVWPPMAMAAGGRGGRTRR